MKYFTDSATLINCFLFFWNFPSSKGLLKPRWTYDLIEITTFTSNPDCVEMNATVHRIDRGRYGYSGYLNFNSDMGEDILILVTVQRSIQKEGSFGYLPFLGYNVTLPVAMNLYYKPLLMKSVQQCCENAPVFEKSFTPPITKRNISINKCELSNEALPLIMLDGYYKLRTTFFGNDFYGYMEALAYVEN
ncbi:uncharacterized protein [Musca autumnalis]|uniref:uncharacterized protein n=1 Tax=Musca autumnalis TaxID=221902 RepID=UPI003CF9675C